jgi:AraC-like DNA-binding protein
MQDFFKYLTPGEGDKKWGLYLSVAGRSQTQAGGRYPSTEHPTGYFFTWERGRVLEEYQLVYISEGAGVLQNRAGKHPARAGSVLLLRPGEYHRYRPLSETGWTEWFVGFQGHLADHFYRHTPLLNKEPLISYGFREDLIEIYNRIFAQIQEEKPGYQQIASGLVVQLLGLLVAHDRQGDFSGKPIENIIQKARLYMRDWADEDIDLQKLAEDYHISYATFRKMFKKYTGMSPRQYHLELKLRRAKELLLTTDHSIKEISQTLNFESIHYFSRYFKKKMGYPPSGVRKNRE